MEQIGILLSRPLNMLINLPLKTFLNLPPQVLASIPLLDFWQYNFMRNALLAVLLIAPIFGLAKAEPKNQRKKGRIQLPDFT